MHFGNIAVNPFSGTKLRCADTTAPHRESMDQSLFLSPPSLSLCCPRLEVLLQSLAACLHGLLLLLQLHAPWALLDYGFRSIIAPSFADIFYNNCAKNGILLVALPEASVQQLFTEIEENVGCELTVDLPNQKVQSPKGLEFSFEIDPFVKNRLLNGLDDIGWTLQYQSEIESFESNYQKQAPWMFVH